MLGQAQVLIQHSSIPMTKRKLSMSYVGPALSVLVKLSLLSQDGGDHGAKVADPVTLNPKP